MSKLWKLAKEEFYALLPPTIFFFVTLHIVALIRSLLLRGTAIPLTSSLTVTLAAIILGKAVLVADHIPLVNRYPAKPLIYNVVWKTVIYLAVSLVFHYAEHLFDYWWEIGDLAAANRALLASIVWPHFLGIQILLTVIIFAYCVIRELVRVIGKQKVIDMFFFQNPGIQT